MLFPFSNRGLHFKSIHVLGPISDIAAYQGCTTTVLVIKTLLLFKGTNGIKITISEINSLIPAREDFPYLRDHRTFIPTGLYTENM